MKEIAFIFVLGTDSGIFDWSTLEKMKIHHSENEEEKWRFCYKLLHVGKLTHMPSPGNMPSPKVLRSSQGDASLIF